MPMTTYYIEHNGDDNNDGLTWKTRKRTIAACFLAMQSGDTIFCGPGEFATHTLVFNGREIDFHPVKRSVHQS